MAPVRLSAEERREAILRAVKKLFAEKGFDGTTTRELAREAGVSEALLFKHFPSKESLYGALQESLCPSKGCREDRKKFDELEPSTATLVILVHLLVSSPVLDPKKDKESDDLLLRLLVRSLTEDGAFARHFLENAFAGVLDKLVECIKAAAAAGDLEAGPVAPRLQGLFVFHLILGIMMHLFPRKPAVDYRVPRESLIEQAVWFSLRGMGLKAAAIKRHYPAKAMALAAR